MLAVMFDPLLAEIDLPRRDAQEDDATGTVALAAIPFAASARAVHPGGSERVSERVKIEKRANGVVRHVDGKNCRRPDAPDEALRA